jgi:hypothetical protein
MKDTPMSGLIVKPAAPASPAGSVLALDGWWPAIDYTDMREAIRIGENTKRASNPRWKPPRYRHG